MAKIKNRRLFTSYISIIVIMSIVLFLFGFFGVFFISSNSLANSFKENFSVSIFFKEDAKKIEITLLQNELLMTDYIEKLKYVSKDDAILIMKEEYGQDFIKELGFNPLVNSIDFNLKSQYVESVILDSISEIISKNKYVDEIVYDNNLLKLINDNIKKITYWIIPSIIIFLLITFLLINSSIRLSIYSNRINIKTMQLVGATRGFIRKPFILTHVKLGFFGAFLAIVMLSGALYYIQNFFDYVNFESDIQIIMAMFGAISVFSILITYLCTFFATQKFLKSKIDQLY